LLQKPTGDLRASPNLTGVAWHRLWRRAPKRPSRRTHNLCGFCREIKKNPVLRTPGAAVDMPVNSFTSRSRKKLGRGTRREKKLRKKYFTNNSQAIRADLIRPKSIAIQCHRSREAVA
jgi:hypothetical protein